MVRKIPVYRQYSTQILALAVLLSSLLVYNQMGGIDEAALDRLSLVTEVTKNIRVQSEHPAGQQDLSRFTPSFLWLLRDMYLSLEEDGRPVRSASTVTLTTGSQAGPCWMPR